MLTMDQRTLGNGDGSIVVTFSHFSLFKLPVLVFLRPVNYALSSTACLTAADITYLINLLNVSPTASNSTPHERLSGEHGAEFSCYKKTHSFFLMG